jgi:hypothetical protein
MSAVPSPITGRCLCGSVTYSADAEPVVQAVCHCTDCQRQTGTAYSVIVGVPSDALQIDGADNLGSFTTVGTDTKQDVKRHFCRECGSPVMSTADALPGLTFIKAGTLNDTSWLEPQLHVWTDSAQPWVPLDAHPGMTLPRGPSA